MSTKQMFERRGEVNRGKFVNSEKQKSLIRNKSKKDLLLKHNGRFCNGELSVISNESDVI